MKIISWNIDVLNKKPRDGIAYIFDQGPDIVCLQEAKEEILSYLKKKKGYNLSYSLQAEGKTNQKNVYKIIITKHKIAGKGTFPVQEKEVVSPWARVVKKVFGLKKIKHTGIYLDLGKKIRIINLHLDASVSPPKRLEQLICSLKHSHKTKATIICGDFNTYGRWYINWVPLLLMRMRLKDFFFDEIKEFRKVFKKNNLNDLFYKMKTVTFFKIIRTHADYILVPEVVKIKSKNIEKERFGSDHDIITAEIEL